MAGRASWNAALTASALGLEGRMTLVGFGEKPGVILCGRSGIDPTALEQVESLKKLIRRIGMRYTVSVLVFSAAREAGLP